MKPPFREKITAHAPALGTLVTLAAPEVSEMLSLCGFDWLFIDMEHGTFSVADVQHSIQAMRGECSALVRVPENSAMWVKRVLDTGCDGVIIPLVNNAAEARAAVRAAKYPPHGIRGAGIARAHDYGMSFGDYVANANDYAAVVIQVEHIESVKHLDEILEAPGVDGVLIGPYDLSGSYGMLGQVRSEPVQSSLDTIKRKCRERGMPFGIFVVNADAAPREIADGCSFIAIGTDSVFLTGAAKDALDLVKNQQPVM
jgi:2-keto-3-deoxy-L-rhamnonate aldolase RhmA